MVVVLTAIIGSREYVLLVALFDLLPPWMYALAFCDDGRLEWPLHLVLTRETMQTYNRLFRLLASVKRASLELERVWPTLMQSRYR